MRTPLPAVAEGRRVTACSSKVEESCEVVVSNATAAPETSIDVTAPFTSNVIDSVVVLFNSILNALTVVFAKFGAQAETLYVPTGRFENRYSPEGLASLEYFAPVSPFTASTLAFGTTAPVLSKTVPTKSPLMTCADVWPTNTSPSTSTAAATNKPRFLYPCFTVPLPKFSSKLKELSNQPT